jgi:hypothetical protein
MRRREDGTIPAAPFAKYLNDRVAHWENRLEDGAIPGAQARVLMELGWTGQTGERRLYRMRYCISETAKGRKTKKGIQGVRAVGTANVFTRRVVEEALHHAGVRLGEVYPYEALIDEFQMEYLVPRDQATRLADAWVESTWQTVWENLGLFVDETARPSCYCRACKRTTRLFMGTCDSCGASHPASMVAAVAAVTLRESAPLTDDHLAQARWLRERYRLSYQAIAVVMAVYHGQARDESSWRRALRGVGVAAFPHGVPFGSKGVAA